MLIKTAARLMLMYRGKIPSPNGSVCERSVMEIKRTRKIVSEWERASCHGDKILSEITKAPTKR
jgi:hypothetical protein